MRRTITFVILLSASLLTIAEEDELPGADEALEAILESVEQTVSAKQISRTAPRYPLLELRKGREAWVHITYCIDETGDIKNVSVLDSVGNERFDKAAIETVQNWEYEPASQDGKPVWQSRNNVLISFALEGEGLGASKKFIRKFRRIGMYIEDGNLQEADDLFWTVYNTYDLNMYELAKLWAQRVRYEATVGDLYKLDMALHRATASHGEWIDKRSYIRLLTFRTQVELQIGKYDAAKHSFNDLVDITKEDAEEVLALRPSFERLQEMITGNQILKVYAEVRSRGDCAFCDDSWDFTPVRDDFTFANIQGNLNSIDMRCDNKRFESDILELVEWHIPEKWGKCHVQVYGEPGTTFEVLLLPAETD